MLFHLAICLSSFVITWIVREVAIRKSIMDVPNHRSSHSAPTPRGGGLAVALTWFAGLIFFFAKGIIDKNLFYALVSGLPLTLIGFVDDVFSLKPGVRFLVQFICAALALWFLGGLHHFQFASWNLEPGTWNLELILTPLAFIAIIWFINLFNFLDGIDGYIGVETVFIGVSLYILTGSSIGLLLATATFGFLIWNWPRAKIFMGDVGSTLLGFSVAVLTVYHQNNLSLSIPVWLILTSVFWFDATVTLIRRIMNKEKLSQAHRKHAYQRIVQAGFSHRKTTLWMIGINIFGLVLAWLANRFSIYDWAFLLVDIFLLTSILCWIDKKRPFEYTGN